MNKTTRYSPGDTGTGGADGIGASGGIRLTVGGDTCLTANMVTVRSES